jgi:hypothetical protein
MTRINLALASFEIAVEVSDPHVATGSEPQSAIARDQHVANPGSRSAPNNWLGGRPLIPVTVHVEWADGSGEGELDGWMQQ